MATIIRTVEYHRAEIEKDTAANARRLDLDGEDAALSTWAASQMITWNHIAIKALELGAAHGMQGPAVEAVVLVNADGEIVSTERVEGEWGMSWKVRPAHVATVGRRFVPCVKREGGTSRIQKSLGLVETTRVVPAEREPIKECAFAGAPVWYTLRPVVG